MEGEVYLLQKKAVKCRCRKKQTNDQERRRQRRGPKMKPAMAIGGYQAVLDVTFYSHLRTYGEILGAGSRLGKD